MTTTTSTRIHLSGEQVRAVQAAKAMTNVEFADEIGCSRSQIVIYRRAGLPSRMSSGARRRMVTLAVETGVLRTAENEGAVFL